jgi:hypothetical protein
VFDFPWVSQICSFLFLGPGSVRRWSFLFPAADLLLGLFHFLGPRRRCPPAGCLAQQVIPGPHASALLWRPDLSPCFGFRRVSRSAASPAFRSRSSSAPSAFIFFCSAGSELGITALPRSRVEPL